MKQSLGFLRSNAISYDENFVYIYSPPLYAVVRISRTDGKLKFIFIPLEYRRCELPFRIVICVGEKLILPPYEVKEFLIYSLNTGEFVTAALPENSYKDGEMWGIGSYSICGDDIYMFGYHPVIFRYNCKDENITSSRKWESVYPIHIEKRFGFEKKAFYYNKRIYMVIGVHRHILDMSKDMEDIRLYDISLDHTSSYHDSGMDGYGDLWAWDEDSGDLVAWNADTNKKVIKKSIGNLDKGNFYSSEMLGDNIIFLPSENSKIKYYDTKNDEWGIVDTESERDKNYLSIECSFYSSTKTQDGHILAINWKEPSLIDLDSRLNVRRVCIPINIDNIVGKILYSNNSNRIINETDIGLEFFIKAVIQNNMDVCSRQKL